ncbi:hypothetical protein [Aquimarina sp. I32.4]|uniref:hypothetical protein n=1 Tax=Aquimarina sp. I32.4 TaxID=2053903 RepID=UPI000CDE7827|nr:hypothetical protein [Aquimarina sp. I32.4]
MLGIKEINIVKLSYLILLTTITVSCQKNKVNQLIKITDLSNDLHEISGIALLSDQKLYAINDSGNSNTLFCLNQKGKILKKIKIPKTKNIDWEDLAYGKKDTLYIGDFGNNSNDRKNLRIYKVSPPFSEKTSVSKIEFSFPDQKKFPPKKKNLNFDVEAFLCFNNNLYLFTKNRGKDKRGITTVYRVPTESGKHIAKLVGNYTTCNDPSDCLITGATINSSGDKIALLTHNKIFLLSNFNDTNLSDANIQKIKLYHTSQKEGICFKNDSTLYITDEKKGLQKAGLYEYRFK